MKSFRTLKMGMVAGLLATAAFVQAAPPLQAQSFDRENRGPAKKMLQAKLEAMDWYASSEAMTLRFTLHNPTTESLWVMSWMLPSDDMDANLFTVQRDGEAVTYLGPLVKRAAADVEDWIEIKAGQSYSIVFDPSASYDMTGKGQYAIQYRVNQIAVRHKAPQRALDPGSHLGMVKAQNADTQPHGNASVVTASTELFYEGIPANAETKAQELTLIGGYTKCTTSQQAKLATAHQNAINISGKALSQLGTANPFNFVWWFNTASTSSINNVQGHFSKINDAFANKAVTYDCSCKKRYYAYVYPTQPYKIYVCSVFWTAPDLGRDSKAGTLVHEMSHFNVVASTDDWVYGATGAHSLALSDPTKAMDNADNHEYFAEDQK